MLAPEREEEQPSNIVPLSGRAASRRRRGRWLAIAVVLVVVAAIAIVLTRGGEPGVGTARELRRTVEVRSGGGGAFRSVRTHPKVVAGDLLRTGRIGRGQIDYGDGSITRLDSKTTFEVKELATSGKRVVRSELTRGRIWNNVRKLASVDDRFEVRTPNAVATVRGTIFMVEVVPNGRGGTDTTVAQVTGRTDVSFDGRTQSLTAHGCTTNGGPCKYTAEELASMPFMNRNAAQDGVPLPWAPKPSEKASEAAAARPASVTASAGRTADAVSDAPIDRAPRDERSSLADRDDDGEDHEQESDDDERDSAFRDRRQSSPDTSSGSTTSGSDTSSGSTTSGSDTSSGGSDSPGGDSYDPFDDGDDPAAGSRNKNDNRDGQFPDGNAGRGDDDKDKKDKKDKKDH